jgi:subtilase family serine protease
MGKNIAVILCFITLSLPNLAAQVGGGAGQRNDDTLVLSTGAGYTRVNRENDRGRVDGNTRLPRITLMLRRTPEQRAALGRLLDEQQNPTSPDYHRWLTAQEFGARFGASQNSLGEVLAWLREQGLELESTAFGRGWIVATGTVHQAENAFRTEIHWYRVGGKLHFAPATAPTIPPELERIVASIRGLDDFRWQASPRFQPMYTAGDGTHAIAPADLTTIYNFAGGDGTGQGIVIVGQSDIYLSDIGTFRQTFGLPAGVPQTILIGADPGVDLGGDMLEAGADLEWAGAAAPVQA